MGENVAIGAVFAGFAVLLFAAVISNMTLGWVAVAFIFAGFMFFALG